MHRSLSVFRHRPYALWICCGLLLSGCGARQPETAPVTGRVTLGGKAVASGRVFFYPVEGRAAQGEIGPDGHYTLTTFERGDGALLGKQQVTIRVVRVSGSPMAIMEPRPGERVLSAGEQKTTTQPEAPYQQQHLEWLVPEKYAHQNTSPLTATVARGANTINFDLPK